MKDPFDYLPLDDPDNESAQEVCDDCGRSVVDPDGGTAFVTCQSCKDDFQLLLDADKLRARDWTLEVVKYSGRPRTRTPDDDAAPTG